MASNTEISNMAIGHCGVGKEIANLDTENSPEANICRRYFDDAMNSFQRDFPYAFATKRVTLGLVREDPNDDYQYEYTYPSDCQIAGNMVSGLRNDSRQSRPHYKIVRGASGKLIWTDCEDAILEYQIIESDAGRYRSDFVLGFSFFLASLIAPTLTKGDPFGLGDKAERKWVLWESKARANDINENQEEEKVESEFIRVREGQSTDTAEDWTSFPINYRVS